VDRDDLEPIILTNKRRRRRARRRMRLRLGPWVWRAGLAAVLLGVFGLFLARALEPYAMRFRQKQETRQLNRELAEATELNKQLKRQIQMLQSGQGLEVEARKLGYVRQGEIPLQVTLVAPEKAAE
jgi:cell division protein FtsB